MKKIIGTLMFGVLAILMLTLGEAAAQTNLLSNGTFETGDLTDWLVFGAGASSNVVVQSPDNGPTFGGMYNAFLDNRAEAVGLTLKQSTPAGSAGAGTVWYSVDLKLDAAANGGVLFLQMFAEQPNGGVIGGSGLIGPLWPTDGWVAYTGTFVAPAGTDFLTMQVVATTGAVTGSVCQAHMDNAFLSQDGEPVGVAPRAWSDVKSLFQ